MTENERKLLLEMAKLFIDMPKPIELIQLEEPIRILHDQICVEASKNGEWHMPIDSAAFK